MFKVGFEVAGAIRIRIDEARTIATERFKESARVAAVLGARILIPGVKGAESSIRPEVRPVPEIHQPEYAILDSSHPGRGIALEQMQFLEPLEYPEWEIDLDAVWVEDLPVEIVRQSFAYDQLVDFGAPACSLLIMEEGKQ